MNRFDLTTPDSTPAQRRTYHSADLVVQGEQRRVYPHRVSKLPQHVRGATPHFDPAGRLPGDFATEYAGRPCKWHSAYCGQADAAHNWCWDCHRTRQGQVRFHSPPQHHSLWHGEDAFYSPPAIVPVAARICHDYQQGPGADTTDSGGVFAQACFLPRATLCGFLSVQLTAGRSGAGPGW